MNYIVNNPALKLIRSTGVTLLIFLHVKPNQLTIFGGVLALVAGFVATTGSFTYAGLLFILGSSMDGFDGELARKTDTDSIQGAFLDSVFDRLGEGFLLIGVIYYLASVHDNLGVLLTVGALFFSLLVSYSRARGESLGLDSSGGIAPREVRVVIVCFSLLISSAFYALMALLVFLSAVTFLQRSIKAFRSSN